MMPSVPRIAALGLLASLASALGSGSGSALAAPCCSAGSAAPTILTGDDSAQLSASIAHSQVIGDAPAAGIPVFRADGDNELTQTLRIEGALLVSDRWQVGASIPFVRRSRSTSSIPGSSASGLGDILFSGAYEALPEWEYSAWKPRGFVFSQVTVPTGPSIHESVFSSNDPWGLGARGRGFYSLGAGALFIKAWGDWDGSILAEAHRPLPRQGLSPSWGGSVALGGGYSARRLPLRAGVSISPIYEGAVRAGLDDGSSRLSDRQLVWNASLQLAWMINRSSTLNGVYTDQTLLGPARTVSLSRSVALSYQQRWER
jgi:hypothetical protein